MGIRIIKIPARAQRMGITKGESEVYQQIQLPSHTVRHKEPKALHQNHRIIRKTAPSQLAAQTHRSPIFEFHQQPSQRLRGKTSPLYSRSRPQPSTASSMAGTLPLTSAQTLIAVRPTIPDIPETPAHSGLHSTEPPAHGPTRDAPSHVPARQGPDRPGPDRHRQDPGLRPASPRAPARLPSGRRRRWRRRPRAGGAGPGAHP
jgi:hypothetical protein